jgi:hypothetical protein
MTSDPEPFELDHNARAAAAKAEALRQGDARELTYLTYLGVRRSRAESKRLEVLRERGARDADAVA